MVLTISGLVLNEFTARIVHMQQENDAMYLGCKLAYMPDSLKKYISDRKVSIFIAQMKSDIN